MSSIAYKNQNPNNTIRPNQYLNVASQTSLGKLYKADAYALHFMKCTPQVTVKDSPDGITFEPTRRTLPQKGFLLYPGCNVESAAYAPICHLLANAGITAHIVKFPQQLPALKPNAAERIVRQHPEIEWTIGGHSMGGIFSGNYALNHPQAIKKMVFMASFPVEKTRLANPQQGKLFISGSHDTVIDRKLQNWMTDHLRNAPNVYFEEIPGGNHAQFGSYGIQQGDGQAIIAPAQQHQFVTDKLIRFILAPLK